MGRGGAEAGRIMGGQWGAMKQVLRCGRVFGNTRTAAAWLLKWSKAKPESCIGQRWFLKPYGGGAAAASSKQQSSMTKTERSSEKGVPVLFEPIRPFITKRS